MYLFVVVAFFIMKMLGDIFYIGLGEYYEIYANSFFLCVFMR